jgi:hypothetical protein
MESKRNEFIHFRVTETERRALDLLSISECRNPSEMMRELLREGLKKRGFDPLGGFAWMPESKEVGQQDEQ